MGARQGKLTRQQLLHKCTVRDLVGSKQAVPTIPDKCTDVATCLKVLADKDCSIAPVFSEELHKESGFIDVLDILSFLAKQSKDGQDKGKEKMELKLDTHFAALRSVPCEDVVNPARKESVAVVGPECTVAQAIAKLQQGKAAYLAVLDDNCQRVSNMLSEHDVLLFFLHNLDALHPSPDTTLAEVTLPANPVHCCHLDDITLDAVSLLCEKELTSIGVIDSLEHLVSTLSVTQLRALDVENASDLRLTIADFLHTEEFGGEVYSFPHALCYGHTTLRQAVEAFGTHRKHRLFLVDDSQQPTNVISPADLISIIAQSCWAQRLHGLAAVASLADATERISILKNSKKRKGQWLTITIRSNSTTRSLAGSTSLATRLITRLSEDLPIRDAEEEDEDEEDTHAVPIQPPAFPVKEEREGPTSPHRPVAPVVHLVSRSIRRANAPPLGVNIFYGALGGFLEEHGSDVVLASSFKGAFRTANAPTSFCSAAQTCGVDVATLEYKDFVSADYNLHMLEPEQHCGALWLVELKQSTPLSPFKPKDLVECYDMLKLHAREIIQEDTSTLTMPLIGKGAKANHFQIGRNEVIVELVGFLHWIAENMSDRPNLAAINIVSSNNFTAHALQSAFDLLIPVQLDKLEDIIKQAMARSAQALAQFEGELKKLEQADKAEREEERRLAREQNGSAPSAESERPDWERRATQREKRDTRKKLDDIVTKLRIVHKSVANILAAVQAFKAVREVSIIIVACAVNGRIVAELCSELFLLDDDLLRQQQPQPGGRSAGGRGRGFGAPYADAGRGRGRGFAGQPGAGAGPAPAMAPPPAMAMAPDQNLYGRMTQLKASGKIEKELYHHFQTLRLIGNKAVHSTVLKATTVDLGAIVLAVHGLITCPHFS